MTKTSVHSKTHLTHVRAGLRPTKGTGQGNGQSVTPKQLRAARKAAKKGN